MGWSTKVILGVLVVAIAGVGYLTYGLYEENKRQASTIEELSQQVRAVEQVRQDVVAAAESELSEAADAYLTAAGRMEGRIATLEDTIKDMQGFGWSRLGGMTLWDLRTDLDTTRQDLDIAQQDIERLWSCAQSIDYYLSDLTPFLQC